ncbi:phospholipid-transporting ATPase ABCA3 isoform X2 [Cylas formicarius]|uniref:phospholipid-transporting ATPase ABCA3 isoform X2 n=1 Tax=Cylas formicarius TaxID=197179 RepID=UPI00295831B6|nr:phospholipid-transporting ATPase ABCA3 isoform X2 [Cylas formicarius]
MSNSANYPYDLIRNNDRDSYNSTPVETMGNKFDKFRLLMWKNWLLQYRKPLQTIIEIIAPVLFSIILVVIRSLVDPKPRGPVEFQPFCTLPIPIALCSRQGEQNDLNLRDVTNFGLVYSPKNTALDRAMNPLRLWGIDVAALQNAQELENYFVTHSANTTFAGLQFSDDIANSDHLPDRLSLAIRFPSELRSGGSSYGVNSQNWLTNLVYPIFQTAGPRSPNSSTGATPYYYREGFLGLQHITSLLIILERLNVSLTDFSELAAALPPYLPLITMRRFPHASWYDDMLLTALESFVGMIIMLSFVYTCINTVKTITQEKEKQLKEAMKIMGLPGWLHWTAWFAKSLCYLLISIVLMVILLKVKWYSNTDSTVFTFANPSLMFIFLFFYICATITFCFVVSVFFSKANTAATIAGLAWFITYAPYLFMAQNYDTLSYSSKVIASFASNSAMAFGFQLMIRFEGTGDGVQWSNLWSPVTPDDDLTLGFLTVMLAVDSVLYLLIALYIEAVFPGEYGVPQPWYFPFTSSFWCGRSNQTAVEDFADEAVNEKEYFEKEPRNLHAGIKIRNLRKAFGQKAAVRNLSLNMYEGQITVLLGHNGAGKTTTMSMLTGMITPSSGTAVVGGYDIRTNMDGVRESLGLCPQHNIIFDELTVAEHLYFFSKLKGVKEKDTKEEIDRYVELLELQPKRNEKSTTLSGGMKRKLCVGIALCGNSKVVMLDEPTAGMDPSARRALWDLLLNQKTGRTVLLTTHFMDEADLLGDRIAIMAGGELQCCGSSFFLKKKFGAGYHLIMDKSADCDPMRVTEVLRRHIPNIEIESNIGSELTYLLSENQSYVFEPMLRDLETKTTELGVNSYGISLTTLEEVFMKVGADHGQEEMYNNEVQNGTIENGNYHLSSPDGPQTKVEIGSNAHTTHFELVRNQFKAMFIKKILSTLRSWILSLIQIAIPMIFLIITMAVSKNSGANLDLPPMALDLDRFSGSISLIEVNSQNALVKRYANAYQDVVGSTTETVRSIRESMMNLTRDVPNLVRRHYVIGASLGDSSVSNDNYTFGPDFTAYFNNDPYHTPAIALAHALNTMYRVMLNCTDCGIDFVNYPLPFSLQTQVFRLSSGENMGFQLAFNVAFSMAFVSSFYIIFIVRERVSKAKHLQFVSGVKVYVFWITHLICDLLTYFITIAVYLVTLVCFQEGGFKTFSEIGRMFVILLYFGWAMLPFIYFAGFCFEVPSTGFTRMTLFSIFTGCAAFLIVQVLNTDGLDLEYVGRILDWIFLVIPHYSLATGIRDSYTLYSYNYICDFFYDTCRQTIPNATNEECLNESPEIRAYCEGLDSNYFKWDTPGIGRNLTYSFTVGTVLFAVLLVVAYQVFSKIIYRVTQKYSSKHPKPVPDEDDDVANEKNKISGTPQDELLRKYTLVLKDLTKYYKNHVAVNGLSLGINRYECFGLLGVNGAGKTTTFKMMTGDVRITYGDAWIDSFSVKNDIENVQKRVGYCPQFDALLDDLTARETLKIFGLLRGLRSDECNFVAEHLAREFDFFRHLDKKVKELSGGNKRKLSTSLALIGNPPVLYFDEPTTGMDPATKRYLWNALCKVRDSGKCIVLTSHSMEECEALCTRLAIMVNGNFKCLGSTQHLKSKFAEGYTITIKIKKPENSAADEHSNTEQIERFIRDNFRSAVLREKHEELLTYYVTDRDIPWSRMFGILEEGKRRDLNIEDYSLGQSSLEQVFLTFTKHQV